MKKEKQKNNIDVVEKKFEKLSCKTVVFKKFQDYIKTKNGVAEIVQSFYNDQKWRKMKLRTYVYGKRSIQNFVKKIKRTYPGKLLLIYGDWGTTPGTSQQKKGFTSTMQVGLRREIHKYIPTVSIDEYHTSKLCWRCGTETVKVKKDGKELYPLLRCPNTNKESNHKGDHIITRDLNSTLNMHKLLKCRLADEPRPPQYLKPVWSHRTR